MASIRDTLTKLLASDKPEPGTPLARAVGQYPFQQGEAPLEAPMLSPDDLIGTGIGKAALVGGAKLAPALIGQTAWHGSPQAFEKFLLDKAGTNSGSDFGYGVYFSNNPNVAKAYTTTINSPESKVKTLLDANSGNINKAISSAKKDLSNYQKAPEYIMPGTIEKTQKALDLLKQTKSGKDVEFGNMYKVDIPDEYMPNMIDWYSSKQTPEVENLLKKHGIPTRGTGEDLYFEAINKAGSSDEYKSGFQKASEYLDSIGIKGIKYPNRAMEAQDYVIFNPEQVKILEHKKQSLIDLLKQQ